MGTLTLLYISQPPRFSLLGGSVFYVPEKIRITEMVAKLVACLFCRWVLLDHVHQLLHNSESWHGRNYGEKILL